MSNLKIQGYNSNIKSDNLNSRTYKFSLDMIVFINNLPNKRAFWAIGDQLIRAATSIGANMTEAKASSSRREFIKYYEIALKSANETQYWLYLLRDSYITLRGKCEVLISENLEICKMLGASVLTLKGRRIQS